jgi:hypothetical protein
MMATKRIMRSFRISEVSAVDNPAQKHALATILKHHGETKMNFGKAAAAEYDEAQARYAQRHNLSETAAAVEFSKTQEAGEISNARSERRASRAWLNPPRCRTVR